MRVSKQRSEKYGSACCRHLSSLSLLVHEVGVELAPVDDELTAPLTTFGL